MISDGTLPFKNRTKQFIATLATYDLAETMLHFTVYFNAT